MEKPDRILKRRMALFFGYEGTNYSGIQFQKDPLVRTIENELIQKLFAEGFLKSRSFVELVNNYKWSRAARTDKGVHALFNGISCIFTIPKQFIIASSQKQPQIDKVKMASYIQQMLPQFSIHCVKEVDKTKFLMRQNVKSRYYCYLCPINLFHKESKDTNYLLEKINRLCAYFVGTRNYHNYSTGVKAKDPSAKRFLISMSCKLHEENQEWVRFEIHGQSFIYHQIRKMVGSIVQMFHENQPQNFLENTFFNNIIGVLLAPPDGLYLKFLNFDSYNKAQSIPEPLQFTELQQRLQEAQAKLEEQIMDQEDRTNSFAQWLQRITNNEMVEEVPLGNIDVEE